VDATARRAVQTQFTALLHHGRSNEHSGDRSGERGVDGIMVTEYEQNLEGNLQDLCTRVHTGRACLHPKSGWGQRPLGVPTLGDKIVQGAVAEMLSHLRGRLPWVLLRLSAGAQPAPGFGVAAYGDHEPERELGARC
jgi:RNA-directed DNA polymerase